MSSMPASGGRATPVLFMSHGSPMLVFEEIPARDFLAGLGRRIDESHGRPAAILCVSAHWDTDEPAVSGAARPETIHDFHGFPRELYRLGYPAPGAPALAERVSGLVRGAGLACSVDPARGLDHGAWNPLMLLYPDADIPVTQLSIQTRRTAQEHLALGRALAPLSAEGVLIVGSGGAVHNLRQFQVDRERPAPWAIGFDDWLAASIVGGAVEELVGYREARADSRLAHPSEDHFLPLLVALGAGTAREATGTVLHRSFAHGSLSMAAFGWGIEAA
jgi:4,5-DOPA dioxygenase extradiol